MACRGKASWRWSWQWSPWEWLPQHRQNKNIRLHETKKQRKEISRVKRQPMEWEKISAKHITDKRTSTTQQQEKLITILKSGLPRSYIQMTNRYRKRCSKSFSPQRNGNKKHNKITSYLWGWPFKKHPHPHTLTQKMIGKDVKKLKFFWTVGGNITCATAMENGVEVR